MKVKARKAAAIMLIATLLCTMISSGIVVSSNTLSAENNRIVIEDFDDGAYDESLITSVMGSAPVVENGALKIAHTGGDNIRYRIEGKNAFTNAPAGKAGKLTYDFDIKITNTTGDSNRSIVARDVSTNWNTGTKFVTMKTNLAYNVSTNTISTGESATDGEWYNIKMVFDYTGNHYKIIFIINR